MIFRLKSSNENGILEALDGRSIVLVGIMGCGKSAIGKLVAKKLGLKFLDADTEIEKAAGRSVADIFEEYGEAEFRRLEERVVDRLLGGKSCVLALGGGAFMNEATRTSVLQKAVSVWIRADVEVLLSRVMRKPGKRPLLANGEPRQKLMELLKLREPVYASADLAINPGDVSKIETRNILIAALSDFLSKPGAKPS